MENKEKVIPEDEQAAVGMVIPADPIRSRSVGLEFYRYFWGSDRIWRGEKSGIWLAAVLPPLRSQTRFLLHT